MKKIIAALALIGTFTNFVNAQESAAELRKKPLEAMEQLAGLEGTWQSRVEYSADNGQTWQVAGGGRAEYKFKHKGVMLHEQPLDTDQPGFHMDTSYGYDQYRDVYRVVAVDDVWGIFDLYEGQIEGNKLIVTNMKAATFFPVAEGVWRGFRLNIELSGDTRTTVIDKTDDGGKTWQPNFRITYTKL